jgi:hypothetical protein
MLKKLCVDKQQLVMAYSLAVTRYSSAVHALVNSSNVEDPEKYEEAHRLVEAARKTCAKAHQNLEDYRAEHGC